MHAARDLAAQGPMVIAEGAVVIEVLETKAIGPVTRSDLDAWSNAYHLPVTVVMDPPGTGTPTYHALGVRESTFIIDLSTMRIARKFNGSVLGIGTSGVGQAIPVLMGLLGH